MDEFSNFGDSDRSSRPFALLLSFELLKNRGELIRTVPQTCRVSIRSHRRLATPWLCIQQLALSYHLSVLYWRELALAACHLWNDSIPVDAFYVLQVGATLAVVPVELVPREIRFPTHAHTPIHAQLKNLHLQNLLGNFFVLLLDLELFSFPVSLMHRFLAVFMLVCCRRGEHRCL